MKDKVKKLSAEFCEENSLVVLSEEDGKVIIGFTKQIRPEIQKRLERYYNPAKQIEYRQIKEDEFEVLIARLYSGTGNYKDPGKKTAEEEITDAAKAAPAVNLLNSIMNEGLMKGASDIHIDIHGERTCVRYRKDGKLMHMLDMNRQEGEAVTARIKLLSDLNILEHRKCQDGRFEYKKAAAAYDIRVSVIPGIDGESSVLRILGGDIKAPEIEDLGFTSKQLDTIRKFMQLESGLVIAAGPTGSGKTTTLASIISRLNREELNIITVEDPVEYRIKDVIQVNVQEEIGNTFFEVLKRVLRHDPDILMVGEIRDEQTAAIACRMALTGHLVFASLHTNSCRETPLRLIDMGVPSYIVNAVLKGVISQRLVEKKGGGRTVKADLCFFEKQEMVRSLCQET